MVKDTLLIKEMSQAIRIYFENIRTALDIYLEEQGLKIVIFGPGETKRKFLNHLREKNEVYHDKDFVIADGIETAGEDGIYVFLRSETMKDLMSSSKIAMVSKILDRVMQQINNGEKKYAMGIEETKYANSLNAIDSLVYSDKVFSEIKEDEFIKLLNNMEYNNVKIYATDSTTDIGLRVSSLGGIIALLRYRIN